MKYRLSINVTCVVDTPDSMDIGALHDAFNEDMSVDVNSTDERITIEDFHAEGMEAIEVRES